MRLCTRHPAARAALAVTAVAALAAPAAFGAGRLLGARLTPVASSSGSGTFTAKATTSKTAAVLRWQLTVSKLSGTATRVTLRVRSGQRLRFVLCKPCKPRSKGEVALVRPIWDDIVARGAIVVVETRAHPRGELRGVAKVS